MPSIDVSADLMAEIEQSAALSGQSLKDLTSEALRIHVERQRAIGELLDARIADADAGDLISHDEARAEFEQRVEMHRRG